jgi:hypothetical protein
MNTRIRVCKASEDDSLEITLGSDLTYMYQGASLINGPGDATSFGLKRCW